MPGNTSKRGWTPEEDQIIVQIVSSCPEDKHKWVLVSKELFQRTGRQRTGKQCRERWQHQLNPAIVRDEWNQFEVTTLFQMQSQFGNKWAQIAAFLPGRTDNAVKNFFYSSVRRVLTKINMYLGKQRNRKEFKTIRQFQSEYMSKLMSVVDGNYEKRLRLSCPEAFELAKDVLKQISLLIITGINQHFEGVDSKLDSQILMMHEFRKSCKKRKQICKYQDNERYEDLSSIDENSSIKDSSSLSSSSSSQRSKRNSEDSKLKMSDSNLIQTMEMQSEKNQQASKSQKTIEEQSLNSEMALPQIKKIDSFYFQIPMVKGFSVLAEQNKEQIWNIFEGEYNFKEDQLKMQQQNFDEKYKEDYDIFSMPYGYREDYLGASHNYEQPQVVVTKFKTLEVSLALDQCLLKAKRPLTP